MAYYNSLSSLGKNTLQLNDTIEFMGIKYKVTKCYLSNQCDTTENAQIFYKLGIEDKYTFCSDYYGYTVTSGIWPEFNNYDFSAATRLVKALFKIIEDKIEDKEEFKLSVLLPSKHRNIKQITIQKEITFSKL